MYKGAIRDTQTEIPMRRFLTALILALLFAEHPPGGAAQSGAATRWYKGSLHAHTINSDGDSPPYDVLTWYKRHGYHFLAITDHNTLTDPASFDTNPTDNFLLLGVKPILS